MYFVLFLNPCTKLIMFISRTVVLEVQGTLRSEKCYKGHSYTSQAYSFDNISSISAHLKNFFHNWTCISAWQFSFCLSCVTFETHTFFFLLSLPFVYFFLIFKWKTKGKNFNNRPKWFIDKAANMEMLIVSITHVYCQCPSFSFNVLKSMFGTGESIYGYKHIVF